MSYNRPAGDTSGGGSPAKEKIDRYIGQLPDLTNLQKEEYQKYASNMANEHYWQGYLDAKIELRNKLYAKEGIEIPRTARVYGSATDFTKKYTPEENLTLYGGL